MPQPAPADQTQQPAQHPVDLPYVPVVVDALNAAGITVTEWDGHEVDELGDGELVLADPIGGPTAAAYADATVMLLWSADHGWTYGLDEEGSGTPDWITDAHLGLRPEPAAVVAWAHRVVAGEYLTDDE